VSYGVSLCAVEVQFLMLACSDHGWLFATCSPVIVHADQQVRYSEFCWFRLLYYAFIILSSSYY